MQKSAHSALQNLHDAASRRDWNACRDAVEAAMAELPSFAILEIARNELAQRLGLFEAHHAGKTWPRAFIESLDVQSGTPGAPVEDPLDEYAGPGGNNFVSGVEALRDAADVFDDARACAARATEAIAQAIMAEITAVWGAKNPERWTAWYEDTFADDPKQSDALVAMVSDPEAAEVELRSWRALEAELSRRLVAETDR
jgi:hypothetical protein